MDLKNLHLEETIILPKNLNEMIFDKNVIAVFDTKTTTPEEEKLHEQGFWGTKGEDDRLHVYFRIDNAAPFTVRVIPNYEDETTIKY